MSVSIEQNTLTLKIRQYRCKCDHPFSRNSPSHTHTKNTLTHNHTTQTPHSHTMMKMLCKSYGRSPTPMPIKPCYTVKAVCHRGPCESEQSLVTPSGIYQRFLVDGSVLGRGFILKDTMHSRGQLQLSVHITVCKTENFFCFSHVQRDTLCVSLRDRNYLCLNNRKQAKTMIHTKIHSYEFGCNKVFS